jgi:hypothetical protein
MPGRFPASRYHVDRHGFLGERSGFRRFFDCRRHGSRHGYLRVRCGGLHVGGPQGEHWRGGAGAGMSQDHTGLQLRNTGSSACTLYGYPGVSWVAGADGQQAGSGATRQADPAGGPETTVTLAPGATASAPLDIADAAALPGSECKPVAVRGLRVYPPGDKAALFIPQSTAGGYGACSEPTTQPTLMVGWVQSGLQPGNGGQG